MFIAFGHRKRVGKDTAARFLASQLRVEHGFNNVVVKGYADKIKDIAFQLYSWAGLKEGHYYDEHPEEKEIPLPTLGKSPRQIYIAIGNCLRSDIYNDTWIDYLLHTVVADICIIKDFRFPNEAQAIQRCGGLLIKISRPGSPIDADGADDQLVNWDGWDYHIINNSDMRGFHNQVVTLTDEIVRRIKA